MKFKQYILNEEISDENVKFIKKNCKPYIDLVKKNNVYNAFLYRGIENINSDFKVKKVRKDRRPRDLNIYLHKILDEILLKKFGWRARSNSLFCNPNEDFIDIFGDPNIIIPIGKFDYLWSSKVKDLQVKVVNSSVGKIFPGIKNPYKPSLKSINKNYNKIFKKDLTIDQFNDFLIDYFNHLIELYDYQKNKGFKNMMDKYSNEVMIHCDKYVISKINNYFKLADELFK